SRARADLRAARGGVRARRDRGRVGAGGAPVARARGARGGDAAQSRLLAALLSGDAGGAAVRSRLQLERPSPLLLARADGAGGRRGAGAQPDGAPGAAAAAESAPAGAA